VIIYSQLATKLKSTEQITQTENNAKKGENSIMNSFTVRDSLLLKYYYHNADEMKEDKKGGMRSLHAPKPLTKF
jgi:hypothetical protein